MEWRLTVRMDAGVVPPAGGDRGDASRRAVAARASTDKDAFEYNMNHERRGLAVIFKINSERTHLQNEPPSDDFLRQDLEMRKGTDVDCDLLENVLKDLDFDVKVHDNLEKSELFDVLDKLSTADHYDADCLVISFLFYGTTGKLHTYDEEVKSGHLWTRFTADHCPSLAGKPKIFFIQVCQGVQMDGGTTLVHSQTSRDSSPMLMRRRTATEGDVGSYTIPTHADFLLCNSAPAGYRSWQDDTQGSWFVQALVHCLRQYGRQLDLLTIMTRANRLVATDFQTDCPDDPDMHQRKQIPRVISMLTRDVFFPPKTRRN